MYKIIEESHVPHTDATLLVFDQDHPYSYWTTAYIDDEPIKPMYATNLPRNAIVVSGKRTGDVGKTISFK